MFKLLKKQNKNFFHLQNLFLELKNISFLDKIVYLILSKKDRKLNLSLKLMTLKNIEFLTIIELLDKFLEKHSIGVYN